MSTKQSRRGAVPVVAALVLVLAVVFSSQPAFAHPAQIAAGTSIADTANGFSYTVPEFSNLPLNTVINVTFSNNDPAQLTHTFTILNRSDWAFKDGAGASNVTDELTKHGVLLNLIADYQATKQGSFRSPANASWYEFLCNESGHFEEGMFGYIAFGMAVPSNLSIGAGPSGPGLPVFIIVGTIVVLTVLAIVLGFVFGRREGSIHEMAPERLGYPEAPGEPARPRT